MMAMNHQHDDNLTNDLIISVDPELRRRIKRAAAQNNLSVQEYVEHLLEQVVPPQPVTMHEHSGKLKRRAVDVLLQYREEIKRNHPGQVLEDSSELLYQAHEERARELVGTLVW